VNRVTRQLWIGAAPRPGRPYPGIDVIVLCAREHQPVLSGFPGLVIRAPFADRDIPTPQDRKTAIRAAREVSRRLRKGQRVLVTCVKGWNRSGLVVGLTLKMMGRGLRADQIIQAIRQARGESALSNPAFVRILRGFGEGRGRPHRMKRDT
jgi:protein-tyrosine phosphatase